MSAVPDHLPAARDLSAADRITLARQALSSGLFSLVLEAVGWDVRDLAAHIGERPLTVARWETGDAVPGDVSALRLWAVLVRLCRTPPDGT